MNLLEEVLPIRKFAYFTGITTVFVSGLAHIGSDQSGSIILGYLLCAANFLAMAYLLGLILNIYTGIEDKESEQTSKGFVMALGVTKTALLFVSLFVLLYIYRLSGLHLFYGSLSASVLLSGWVTVRYLQYLSDESLKRRQIPNVPKKEAKEASYETIIKHKVKN